MPKSTNILTDILIHVAASEDPLQPLAQKEIADIGLKDKTNNGSALLVALAGRNDLSDDVRALIEACPRAAVKVAWLSRTDHPEGYVEKAVAKEKRVTILAEAAAHPNSAAALVDALSHVDSVKVAVAVLSREGISDQAKVNAMSTLLSHGNTNYQAARIEATVLTDNPPLWDAIAKKAKTSEAVWKLCAHRGFVIPQSELTRFAKVILRKWDDHLPAPGARGARSAWGIPTNRYHAAAATLLGNPHWDPNTPEDGELALMAQRLREYSSQLSEAVEACRVRHFGTPAEKEAARAAEEQFKRDVALAKTTSSDNEIDRLIASPSFAVAASLKENPNVTLEHILKDHLSRGRVYWSEELILSRLNHGEDPVRVAAALMVFDNLSYSRLPEDLTKQLSDSDLTKVGELIPGMTRAMGSSRWLSLGVARLADNPHILAGVIPQMTVQELHELVTYEYIAASVKKSIAEVLAVHLQQGLNDTTAWKTFAVLAGQSEGSLTETIRVATLV